MNKELIEKVWKKHAALTVAEKPLYQTVHVARPSYVIGHYKKTDLLVKGAGTLFNIPGSYSKCSIMSWKEDKHTIKKDWERVGELIWDNTVLIK